MGMTKILKYFIYGLLVVWKDKEYPLAEVAAGLSSEPKGNFGNRKVDGLTNLMNLKQYPNLHFLYG